MNNLIGLVRLRFQSKFKRLIFTLICNFSSVVLEKKVGSGSKAIIYTAEFFVREKYTMFLEELVKTSPTGYTLYFFRRKLSHPKCFRKYSTRIMSDARKLYTKYLAFHSDLIFFLPHQISSEAILSASEESPIKHRTSCLQHGYYNYSEAEKEIYSASNRTDHAFIFELDQKTISFFRNVENLHVVGYYFADPKPKEIPYTPGISVILTKVSDEQLLSCLNYIFCEFGSSQLYKICLHPHQKHQKSRMEKIVNSLTDSCEFTDFPVQGDVNVFYETTAFYSFTKLFGKSYFLSRDHELSPLLSLSISNATSHLNFHINNVLQ